MESMSCGFMNFMIDKEPESTMTKKQFKSVIGDFSKLNDVGHDLIFDLGGQINDENEVWRVAWSLNQAPSRRSAPQTRFGRCRAPGKRLCRLWEQNELCRAPLGRAAPQM